MHAVDWRHDELAVQPPHQSISRGKQQDRAAGGWRGQAGSTWERRRRPTCCQARPRSSANFFSQDPAAWHIGAVAAAGAAVRGLCRRRGATRQHGPPRQRLQRRVGRELVAAPSRGAAAPERAQPHLPSCLEGRGSLDSSPKWRHSASGCRPCRPDGGMLEEVAAVARTKLRSLPTPPEACCGRIAVATGSRRSVRKRRSGGGQ